MRLRRLGLRGDDHRARPGGGSRGGVLLVLLGSGLAGGLRAGAEGEHETDEGQRSHRML